MTANPTSQERLEAMLRSAPITQASREKGVNYAVALDLLRQLDELGRALAESEAKVRELEEDVEKEERAHLDTIRDRDTAEEALGEAYQLVMDEWPEWSSWFGYKEALEAMNERLGVDLQKRDALTAANAALEEKLSARERDLREAKVHMDWQQTELRKLIEASRKKGAEHDE